MSDFYIPKKPAHDHWYKEPWMLLVLGGPLVVVIAGLATFYIAWHGSDNVVSKDYYKQGVNIDKTLHQDAMATEHHLQGMASLDSASRKITLNLEGNTTLPDTAHLTISTYTRASEFEAVQKVALSQTSHGTYEGLLSTLNPPTIANTELWYVKIEGGDWRLTAEWSDPLHHALKLKAQN